MQLELMLWTVIREDFTVITMMCYHNSFSCLPLGVWLVMKTTSPNWNVYAS